MFILVSKMNFGKKKRFTSTILFVILLITSFVIFMYQPNANQESNLGFDMINYITSDPLYIDNDSDLIGNSTSGSGTPIDPYVIEDLSIVTTDTYGIYIGSTTVSFIIKDCYIDAGDYGIYIVNAGLTNVQIDNNIIENHDTAGILISDSDDFNVTSNYCTNNYAGIRIEWLDDGLVKNNTCIDGYLGIYSSYADYVSYFENDCSFNNYDGIEIENCNTNTLIGNTCSNNGYYGIMIDQSSYTLVTYSECYDNNYHGIYAYSDDHSTFDLNNLYDNNFNGIRIDNSNYDILSNNTVETNDGIGIYVYGSTNIDLLTNVVNNDGFGFRLNNLADYATLTIFGNTVNGKYLGYFHSLTLGTVLDNIYGQVFLVDCDSTVVRDIQIKDTDYALTLIGCDSVTVRNCDFNDNFEGSISFDGTMNCTIMNSKCSDNDGYGVHLGGVMHTVLDNVTVSNNNYGLYHVSSTNITIYQCTFNVNNIVGVYLAEGGLANIDYNGFTNSGSNGIYFSNFDYANITYNWFEGNTGYAIYLNSLSTGNWIHHNAFVSNNVGGTSQACDDTMDLNLWYDPWAMEGNYWDDYSGSGNYTIDGVGQANDTYPYGSIPPGVYEFSNITYLIFLVPVILCSIIIIKRRKR